MYLTGSGDGDFLCPLALLGEVRDLRLDRLLTTTSHSGSAEASTLSGRRDLWFDILLSFFVILERSLLATMGIGIFLRDDDDLLRITFVFLVDDRDVLDVEGESDECKSSSLNVMDALEGLDDIVLSRREVVDVFLEFLVTEA